MDVFRPVEEGVSVDEGSLHSAGIVDGLTVFEMMEMQVKYTSGVSGKWKYDLPLSTLLSATLATFNTCHNRPQAKIPFMENPSSGDHRLN